MKVFKSMLQFSLLVKPLYFVIFYCLLLGTFLVQFMDCYKIVTLSIKSILEYS